MVFWDGDIVHFFTSIQDFKAFFIAAFAEVPSGALTQHPDVGEKEDGWSVDDKDQISPVLQPPVEEGDCHATEDEHGVEEETGEYSTFWPNQLQCWKGREGVKTK